MIANNIKSLFIHIVINILALIVFIIFHASVAKWASEEAANKHHVYMLIIAVIIIIIALVLYYFFSRVFLVDQGSSFKNILSINITALIGMVLWLSAYYAGLTNGTKILLNSQLWQLYSIYYGYCAFLVDESAIGSPYIMLLFCILPILAMWLGIKK